MDIPWIEWICGYELASVLRKVGMRVYTGGNKGSGYEDMMV